LHAEHPRPLDDRPGIEFVVRRARESGTRRVYPIAAVTRGQMGETLTEIEDLVEAGAVGVSTMESRSGTPRSCAARSS